MEKDNVEITVSLSNVKKFFKKDLKWYFLTVLMFGFAVYVYIFPSKPNQSASNPSKANTKPTIYKVGNVVGYQVQIDEAQNYAVAVSDNSCHHIILQAQNDKDIILRFDGRKDQKKQIYLEKGLYMFTLVPNGNQTAKAAIDIQPTE
jgi:hypothetical protein